MKILYIWDGTRDELEEREANIASSLEMYPDVEVLVITRDKDFKCDQKLKDRFTFLDMDEMLKETNCHRAHYYSESDHLRWWYCSKHEDILYLDTDTTALKPIPKDMVFGISRFDQCMIYNGKRLDYCKEFYDRHKRKNIFYMQSIREFGFNMPEFITDLTPYFRHHGASSTNTDKYFIELEGKE